MKNTFLFAVLITIMSCGSEDAAKKARVYNMEDGSVFEVKEYLKATLKDPESYDPISWGPVQSISSVDVIEIKKNKGKCKYYEDETHKKESEDSPLTADDVDMTNIYVLENKEGWIKFRFTFSKNFNTNTNHAKSPIYYCQEKNTVVSENIDPDVAFSVQHKYRAKNSFGGFVINDQTFYLDKNGRVIKAI